MVGVGTASLGEKARMGLSPKSHYVGLRYKFINVVVKLTILR
jgi:hypothetical protein